jgi:lathosterol oxidase
MNLYQEFIVFVVSYDVWFYISHVFLHHPYWYTKIHRKHHSVNPGTMTFADTYVAHWVEGPLQSVGVLLPLLFYHSTSFLVAVSFLQLRGLARHDKRSNWLIGNHHLLHHKDPRYNFGEYWLDTLFGTRYPVKEEYEYGYLYM